MNWNYRKYWKTSHWYGDLMFPNEITRFTEALTRSIFEYIKNWKQISQMRHLLINNLVLKNPTMVQDVWGQEHLKWNWRHSFEHKEAFNKINIGFHILFFCNDKNDDDNEDDDNNNKRLQRWFFGSRPNFVLIWNGKPFHSEADFLRQNIWGLISPSFLLMNNETTVCERARNCMKEKD